MAKITLRASGAQAPADMKPGEWIVRCEHGEIKQRGNKISAVLSFSVLGRVIDKGFVTENAGVILKQWYFLSQIDPNDGDVILEIQPYSKYGTAWTLAMGRPFKSGEDPSPKAFEKKIFRVDVGFSSAADGSFSYRNLGRKKDPRDFLRIHTILEKIEEKTLTHMTPYEPIGGHVHVHEYVNGHEHDTRALASASTRTQVSAETDNKVIRMNGASHKGYEQVPQGHANQAPGDFKQRAPDAKKGVTTIDVLRIFPGAKVIQAPPEEQFQFIKSLKES
jgi:hypothetical protein